MTTRFATSAAGFLILGLGALFGTQVASIHPKPIAGSDRPASFNRTMFVADKGNVFRLSGSTQFADAGGNNKNWLQGGGG